MCDLTYIMTLVITPRANKNATYFHYNCGWDKCSSAFPNCYGMKSVKFQGKIPIMTKMALDFIKPPKKLDFQT